MTNKSAEFISLVLCTVLFLGLTGAGHGDFDNYDHCSSAISTQCAAVDNKELRTPSICRNAEDELIYKQSELSWAENGSIDCGEFNRTAFEESLSELSESHGFLNKLPYKEILLTLFFLIPISLSYISIREYENPKYFALSYLTVMVWPPVANFILKELVYYPSYLWFLGIFIPPLIALYTLNRKAKMSAEHLFWQLTIYLGALVFYIFYQSLLGPALVAI